MFDRVNMPRGTISGEGLTRVFFIYIYSCQRQFVCRPETQVLMICVLRYGHAVADNVLVLLDVGTVVLIFRVF